MKLLSRPSCNHLRVDGYDLHEIDSQSWRPQALHHSEINMCLTTRSTPKGSNPEGKDGNVKYT